VYPVLFRIGTFDITSFGVMVALGALAGLLVFRNELRRSRLPETAVDAAVYGLVGGLVGAKLLYVFEHLSESSFWALALDRGGMSWFGGFVGGIVAGLLMIRIKKWPALAVLAAATPALAVGQMLGRIGCFLVGDDYGRPTSLPWGVAFPQGLPPTFDRQQPPQ
jgi:phosphatidylglycerol:prolipoprotein diacylglycerol transferase